MISTWKSARPCLEFWACTNTAYQIKYWDHPYYKVTAQNLIRHNTFATKQSKDYSIGYLSDVILQKHSRGSRILVRYTSKIVFKENQPAFCSISESDLCSAWINSKKFLKPMDLGILNFCRNRYRRVSAPRKEIQK